MATTRDLIVKILGDTSSLKSSLQSGEQSLNNFQSGVSSKFKDFDPLKDLGKSVGSTIAGYAAVGVAASAAFNLIKSSVGAAMEDAQEQQILAQALRDTTGATNEQISANESWITSTQNATGIMDSQIRDALVPLLAATHSVTDAHTLLQTAMDISTARGLDLTAVSVALAKAHDGNVGALGRLGISYKDAEGNALSFQEVVDRANQTFGGATAAAADTAAGKLQILNAEWKDMQEQIGNTLLPTISQLVDVLNNDLVPAWSNVAGATGKASGALMDFRDKALSVTGTIISSLGSALNWLGGVVNFPGLGGGGGGGGGKGGPAQPGGTLNSILGRPEGNVTRNTPSSDIIFGLGITGVSQAMAQQKYKQDALAAWVGGLPSAGGGGGGGKSQAQKDAEKAAKDAIEAQEKAFKDYLDLLVNVRDEKRKIEDEMYDDDKLSLEQYMAILEKRLVGVQENSDEWMSIKDQERQVLRDHEQQEVADAKKAADDLKKVNDQRIKDAEDLANHLMEIQDNMYEVGAISVTDYIAILQQRLGQFEQFSNEWTRIYEEIQQLGGSTGGFSRGGAGVGAGQTVFANGQSTLGAGINVTGNIYVQMDGQYDPNKIVDAVQRYALPNGGVLIPGGVTAV